MRLNFGIRSTMKKFNLFKFLICFTVFLITNSVVSGDENTYQEIVDDLPTADDMEYYLDALERATEYCQEQNKDQFDVNTLFGLFMIELNLRHYWHERLPEAIKPRLGKILDKTMVIYQDYDNITQNSKSLSTLEKEMVDIFQNASLWQKPDKFHIALLNKTVIYSPEQLETIYGDYESYVYKVFNFYEYKPTPAESDECMLELLERAPSLRFYPNCVASTYCRRLMQDGSDYGYGLSHRILYMCLARFARKCTVFSEKQDKAKLDLYCTKSFNEGQFIGVNYFQLLDLLSEQMTLCGLLGHSQFMRNLWVKTILQFQIPEGCFMDLSEIFMNGTSTIKQARRRPHINKTIGVFCDVHFTGLAVSMVANAVRLILETSYAHFYLTPDDGRRSPN